jgi:hypothetical protein
MNDPFCGDEAPASPEERAEAELLREALETGGDAGGGSGVATARLLQAVSETAPLGEVAARRLRRDLVAEVGRRSRSAFVWAALSAAAAVALAAALVFGRARQAPAPALLAAREAEAREAVARAGARSRVAQAGGDISSITLVALSRTRTDETFSTLDSERLSRRFAQALSGAGLEARPFEGNPATTPTPGGHS